MGSSARLLITKSGVGQYDFDSYEATIGYDIQVDDNVHSYVVGLGHGVLSFRKKDLTDRFPHEKTRK